MMSSLPLHLSPAVLGLLALFLSLIWMLRDDRDKTRPVVVLALFINLLYGFALNVLGRENEWVPFKYDRVLAAIDATLGIDTPSIAAALQGGWRLVLGLVYDLLVPMMILWYIAGRYQNRSQRRPGSVVRCYIAEMLAGPALYLVVPACGPLYVFGEAFVHPGAVHADLIRSTGIPSAFPSLHLATAMVFVFFSRGFLWRIGSLAMLAGTALGAISTGEHYFIDLVAGAAFGCFAASVGHKRWFAAVFNLAVTAGWSAAVRYQFQYLIDRPVLLRLSAALTVVVAVASVAKEWMSPTLYSASDLSDDVATYTFEAPLTGTDN